MSQIGETIFLPGMPIPGSPISTGTAASAGGLNGMLNPATLINPATIIATMGAPAIAGLFDKLFGGREQSSGRLPLPQRPQGQITNPTKIGSFEETYGAAPPGFVYDEQGFLRNTDPNDNGYYINAGGNPVMSTPPLVPVPKPTTGAAGGGGSTGGGADGGFDDPNEIDPDLTGGGSPGGIGDGGGGPTEMDKPPTEYTDAEWSQIIKDWFIRFPDASDADKEAAITQYGVPRDVVNQVLAEQANTGTGGTGGTGAGTGTGTGGAGGTGGSTGGAVTPTVPIVPPVAPVGDTGAGTGTGTGTGTGSGSGGSSGSPGGMFTAQGPLPSELVFPELFKLKKDYEVLNNLLTYRPQGLFR
jgi:hypothetical protein